MTVLADSLGSGSIGFPPGEQLALEFADPLAPGFDRGELFAHLGAERR